MKKRCEPCWDLGAKHSSRGSSKYKDPQGSAKVELFCGWVQASKPKPAPQSSRLTCCLSPWVGCPTTSTGKVLEQTLSLLWDELLVFEQLTMNGRREHLQEAPPMVTINVFDHKFVSVAWNPLGFPLLSTPTMCLDDPLPWLLSFSFCLPCPASYRGPPCS